MAINFDEAILAHSRWKTRLKKLAEGTSTEKVDIVALGKDNLCDLGKWIDAERPRLKDDPQFKELLESHAEFHRCAAEVARTIQSGKRKEAQEALTALSSPFAHASTKVISVISSLRTRIK